MLIHAVRKNNIVQLAESLNSRTALSTHDLAEALIVASQLGSLSAAELLLQKGAPVDFVPETGELTDYSPLYAAAHFGHADVVRLLIQHGADVNLAPKSHGMTPLSAAIDYEADTASQVGETPHMTASSFLFEAGADPNIRDLRGKSALEVAQVYNYQEAIRLFTTPKE